ncbi:hypothetical protein D9M68_566260 [compost metagenome]
MKTPHEPLPPDTGLRAEYEQEVRGLAKLVEQMRFEGATSETIARTVSSARLALSRRYKDATPEPMRGRIIARTLAVYGNPDGPDLEYLRSRGKSWEDIIASAIRPGPVVTGL